MSTDTNRRGFLKLLGAVGAAAVAIPFGGLKAAAIELQYYGVDEDPADNIAGPFVPELWARERIEDYKRHMLFTKEIK